MYDRMLFPTDGSAGARAVVDHVLDIAAFHDATLHVLNVADTTHDSVTRIGTDIVDALETEGKETVDSVVDRAADRDIETVTEVLQGGVSASIAAYATEYGIDLIAMATRGREGIEEALIGNTTERVIRRADVPVLALRPDEDQTYPYPDLLVPTDGSDAAGEALDHGVRLAERQGAALHILSVIEFNNFGIDIGSDRYAETLEAEAASIVDDATAVAERASVESVVGSTVWNASVANAIRDYADDNGIDGIVMGTGGRSGLERYLLGSVTETVVRTASVPVLTVPASEPEE